ncbi:MAG: hypothetical protein KatS3mg097_533 [Candidatus Parcubacteria bacterium]|nr:MAG: hypothetical protein KatS3mg097_533 [Candidatus Parcubacteria bacterium]
MKDKDKKVKTAKQLERYFKGVANHRRIEILYLIAEQEGITLDGIAGILNCNFKTASEHTRRLVQAGLVKKEYQGRWVVHFLTPYGKRFLEFIKTFQHS